MLPPDNPSSLVPWRVLVVIMQVFGLFPYRMSSTSAPPGFSLPLCLWSVFVQITQAVTLYMIAETNFLVYLTLDVNFGIATYIYTAMFLFTTIVLCALLLTVRSSLMAGLLHELAEMKDASDSPTHTFYFKPQMLLLLVASAAFVAFSIFFTTTRMGLTYLLEKLFYVSGCLASTVVFLLLGELCAKVFDVLGLHVVRATKDTIAALSTLLAPDGSFKSESDLEAAMVAMRDLDSIIREV